MSNDNMSKLRKERMRKMQAEISMIEEFFDIEEDFEPHAKDFAIDYKMLEREINNRNGN